MFFSIVIPTFNCADFIRETVEMVRGQCFGDWELVMVDDGSTDETWEILKQLVSTDTRIKIDQRPKSRSKGPSACRNIGVENSKGQYTAFLDADDAWSVDRLQHAYTFIQETGAKAIYSGAWVIDQKGKYFRESRAIRKGESLFDFTINGDSFAQTSTLLVSSEIAKQVAFPEAIRFHEDFAYFIEVGELVPWSFFSSKDVLVHWEDNHLKKVNYADCLYFYQKYKRKSVDKIARIGYLKYTAHELATRQPRDINFKEFERLLKEEEIHFNLREKILFNWPILYKKIFYLSNKLKSLNGKN
ncbi:glycosyltransferase family 2 protein [Aquiflexum sp. TKW24L]|uniref:glycosyltransferase family 2 protein n=1 Tax=Aquiflexum sp. TKW24L TaxID=2942212 RepID=UPI0020BE8C61|nr:glycosyltransferase family 2 protein [Aquiflexum sp. TKW24L]MCL6261229.1 glycosyltransferase family 2 protein [Aquiflexum sp. TKW24L]